VSHHLERVPLVDPSESAAPPDDGPPSDWGDDDEPTPRARPSWWRWVAIAVALAMILATPFAYALDRLLD
jgi:hypothetical protein